MRLLIIISFLCFSAFIFCEQADIKIDFEKFKAIQLAITDYKKTKVLLDNVEITLKTNMNDYVVTLKFPDLYSYVDKTFGFYALVRGEGTLNVELVYTIDKSSSKIINKEYFNRL